ncbi:MAG: MBOAT family protein [Ruminococcaceae bacterium]|nr:MBOAT family protein [Oscillospiraceae bacterium]
MVFSSLFFVFFFLVICYAVYFLAKRMKTRNIILLVSSLIFYAWGGPALVLLLCLMTFICWIGAILIDQNVERRQRLALCIVTSAICLAILIVFKYTGWLMSTAFTLFNIQAVVPSIALPIGISFYTFQLISYVIDVYRGEVGAQKKYWLLLLYASLFHQCIAGPIVRYADVNNDIENRTLSLEDMSRGVSRFAAGLAKKAILANGCGAIVDEIFNSSNGLMMTADGIASLPSAAVLLGSLCYMLQLYLDFSAYSDMAIGMGLMVGFHYKENFNYPYIADSVTDFWRRWHISLSTFFRDYVYIPLGGNRVSVPRHIFNMFVVWALTGIWHGANWNYILWGLYWFVFLVLEKYVLKPKKQPVWYMRAARITITLVIVFFSTMLFKFNDLSALGQAVANIFVSNGQGFSDIQTSLTFKNNIFFLAIAIVACTPIIPALKKLFSKKQLTLRIWTVAEMAMPVVLLVLSAFTLAGDSYNPFLYFQF